MMELEQLALETFNLKSSFQGKNPFELSEEVSDFWSIDESAQTWESTQEAEARSIRDWLYPEGPGVLFYIDRIGPTFCLRGMVSQSLRKDYERFKQEPEILSEIFRIEAGQSEPRDQVLFFETASIELAEVIYDQLFNRRFPVEEDLLCNLSDPGFSWWLKTGEQGLRVYFRSHGINRAQDCVRLGPIGDRKIALMRFQQWQELLRSELKLRQIRLNDKHLAIDVEDITESFYQEVFCLFSEGTLPETWLEKLEQLPSKTLFYYIRELAALRSFWLEVEGQLTCQNFPT